MNSFFRCRYWLTQVILVVIGAIAIACLIAAAPIVAQDNLNRVTIFLDGRPLFEVAPAGSLTAQQRADYVSDTLKHIIEKAPPTIDVEIAGTDNLPVIKVNGNHLLSVTSNDTLTGRSPKEQARFWQTLVQNAMERAFLERTQDYIVQAVFLSVGCGLWGLISSWGVGSLWDHQIKWLFHKKLTKSTHRYRRQPALRAEIAGGTLILLFRVTILVFTLIYTSNLFPQTRQLSRQLNDTFVQSLTWEIIWVGDKPYSVLGLLSLIGLFAALILLAKAVKKVLRSRILSLTNLSRPAQETIALITHYAILFIGVIVLLQLWGIDFSSLAVFVGVLGVGIGLGIQGIAKECVSGLVLIFERPIQVGDFVNVGELMGTVENIGIRSTEILTMDQVSIIIPNSRFLEAEVVNWTHNNPVSRLKLPVGVAYGSDPIKVRSALIEAASQHREI
ncbi:mechanosensitive ion channel domain-containing protein [Moorena sp. SIO3I6]|uniref:mechanosensitive ion channel family protein n=1 Tax=Moorena sp. SIO3I6 TaxID=2607831 RepID=UPI0013FAF27F|nr:mechanosensitive ion channel [Moorena sp. SIO3I6]